MSDSILENWQVQLRKGLLELCILNALRQAPQYGYDIARRLRQVDGVVFGDGTIYPILSRFRSQGLVEATLAESPDGPPRKYYQLTDRGRKSLAEMNAAWDKVQHGLSMLRNGESP